MRLSFLDPGTLNARLTLEQPVAAGDGQGGETITWNLVTELWGMVKAQAVRADEYAGTESVTITHRVTIRTRNDVLRGMRFVWQGRVLLIRAISDPEEAGRYLACRCEEVAP